MYAQYLLVLVSLGAAAAYPQAYIRSAPEGYVVFEVPESDFIEAPGQEYRIKRSLQPANGQGDGYNNGVFSGNIDHDAQGTRVSTGVNKVFFDDKNSRLEGNANWSKVINGPGRAKPVFSGGFNYRW